MHSRSPEVRGSSLAPCLVHWCLLVREHAQDRWSHCLRYLHLLWITAEGRQLHGNTIWSSCRGLAATWHKPFTWTSCVPHQGSRDRPGPHPSSFPHHVTKAASRTLPRGLWRARTGIPTAMKMSQHQAMTRPQRPQTCFFFFFFAFFPRMGLALAGYNDCPRSSINVETVRFL